MAAPGDDVTQDLVGTSPETHQGGRPVEPLEFACQGGTFAAMGEQAVRAEQVERKIGDALAQLAGEHLLDAHLHGGDAAALEDRGRFVAHQGGHLHVGVGLRQPSAKRRAVGGYRAVAARQLREFRQIVDRAA